MRPFIVKAHYWDEYKDTPALDHIQVLIYAPTAADAVRQFEEANYVNDIEDIKVIYAGGEGQFFEVPGHIAKILVEGLGIYRDGLEMIYPDEKIAKKLREDAEKVAPRENSTENISSAIPFAPWANSKEED